MRQSKHETDEDQETGTSRQEQESSVSLLQPMGNCHACGKAWDRYRGKRRCPTCGVPSLICKDCYLADKDGIKKLDKNVRCDLCVEQNVWNKRDLRNKEKKELENYERRALDRGVLLPKASSGVIFAGSVQRTATKKKNDSTKIHNPDKVTRLWLKNMCKNTITEEILMEQIPGITHIVWRYDHRRQQGQFTGQGWVEMESPEAAAEAVSMSGYLRVCGRPLYIEYQPPNGKDVWPPPHSAMR